MNAIPPTALVLLAIVAIQIGAAWASLLFPILGASGTVALRIIFSALLLTLVSHRRVGTFKGTFCDHWKLLLIFGLCLSCMNLFFYAAIDRIPLGAVVAFEFIGPLGVAAFTSRKLTHFAWIGLAALGILLLSPLSGSDLDLLGILFALLAGASWASFIILAGKVGEKIPGNDGLAIALIVAAVAMVPFLVPVTNILITNPSLLLTGLAIALISTTLPFTLEFNALKRLPARSYGILVSLEPGVATLVGAIMLGEQLGNQGILAISCVVVAAIGISLSDHRDT